MNLPPNSSCIPKLWLFQTVFPPRLSSMRASPSTRQPPTWLEHWRTFLLRLFLLEFNVIKSMRKLVRLGIRPRTWLSSMGLLELQEKHRAQMQRTMVSQRDCTHPEFQRYGNLHGRFAKCKRCDQRFKWNQELGAWAVHSPTSSSSSALPLPSQDTILSPSELVHRTTAAKSKSKAAKSKSNQRAGPPTPDQPPVQAPRDP